MIKFTEQAALAIQESMKRAKLDPTKFAFHLYLHQEALSVTFTDDMTGAKQVGAIFVKVDEPIQEYHLSNPLVIDYVTNGDKQGLIFVEEQEYERQNNRESSEGSQEGNGGTEPQAG